MHRLHSIILLVSILLISLYSSASAQTGATYYAAPTGLDRNSGTSPNRPWPLAYALKQLKAGDTLRVMAGAYTASNVVQLRTDQNGSPTAPVTVKAHSDTNPPVIKNGVVIHFQGADWWVIDGLIFEQFEQSTGPRQQIIGMYEREGQISNNITIRNCTFRDTKLEPITLLYGQDMLIEYNNFKRVNTTIPGESAHGIDILRYADRITIRKNRFEDIAADGIHMGATADPDIRQITVAGNTFKMTTDRGVEGENGVDIKEVEGPVTVSNNYFRGFRPTVKDGPGHKGSSNGAGMVIHYGARNVTVAGNRFENNTINLSVNDHQKKGDRATANILVINNIFKDARDYPGLGNERPPGAGIGLTLNGAHKNIKIYHNTFTGNEISLNTPNQWTAATFQNNVVVGGKLSPGDGSTFETGHNAWFQIDGRVPGKLAGANDVRPTDLRLDPALRPLGDSPLINQGLDVGVQTDHDNTSRRDNFPDLGAFEFRPPPAVTLQNPGFETCGFAPWVVESNATIGDAVHSGRCAIRFPGGAEGLVSQVVGGLRPHTIYLVAGWAKVDRRGDQIHIGAMNYQSNDGGITYETVANDVYRFRTKTFTTGDQTRVKIFCRRPAGSGQAYCDDLALAPFIRLLGNPGFESGALYPWVGQGADIKVIGGSPYSGNHAVRLDEQGDQALQRVSGLKPHTTYLLTGWAKVDRANNEITIEARNYENNGAKRESRIRRQVYTFAAFTFTTGNQTWATIACTYTQGSGNAYCDDLTLTPFPTDEGVLAPW